jgi:hypothetical protein
MHHRQRLVRLEMDRPYYVPFREKTLVALGAASPRRQHAQNEAATRRPPPSGHARRRRACPGLPGRKCSLFPAETSRARAKGAGSAKLNRRRPTLPGGCPPSTIGPGRLNFSVRNGKRCDPAGKTAELSKANDAPAEVPHEPWSCFRGQALPHPQNSIVTFQCSKSRPRAISTGPLNALLRLHVPPINVVVFHGSYSL